MLSRKCMYDVCIVIDFAKLVGAITAAATVVF